MGLEGAGKEISTGILLQWNNNNKSVNQTETSNPIFSESREISIFILGKYRQRNSLIYADEQSQLEEILRVENIPIYYNMVEMFVSCGKCGQAIVGSVKNHLNKSHKVKPSQMTNVIEPPVQRRSMQDLSIKVKGFNQCTTAPMEGLRVWDGYRCDTCGKLSNTRHVMDGKNYHPCPEGYEIQLVSLQRFSKAPGCNNWFQVENVRQRTSQARLDADRIYEEVGHLSTHTN
jgi:hypothetical protein